MQDKSTLSEEKLPDLTEIVGDEAKAKEILDASRSSMGQVCRASCNAAYHGGGVGQWFDNVMMTGCCTLKVPAFIHDSFLLPSSHVLPKGADLVSSAS